MNAEKFRAEFETFAEAPDGVEKLREMILQLAVQGKLVPQHNFDEPGSVLLAKVDAERERLNGTIPKQRPSSAITADEQLFQVPAGWAWARFGDLCLYIEAGWSPKCDERPRVGDEWGIIKISAVTWGRFNADENKTLPSNLDPRTECEIRSGDFLMTRANTADLVAKSVVVESTPPRLMLNDKTLRVVFPDCVSSHYVNLFNNGAIARQHYIRVASGTSESMRNVSRENILEMPIPLPPLAEQRRIVAKVDQLLGLCDELAARQAARREARSALVAATLDRLVSPSTPAEFPTHAARLRNHFDQLFDIPTTIPQLRQSILQLAVQGRLVSQDPKDESVLVLIEKISAHRAELAKAGQLRGSISVTPMPAEEASQPIPASWTWVRFGEIMVNRDGERIPVSREERDTKAETYDYYGASGVIDKIDNYLFDKPLLLIGEDGANLINRSTPIAFIARGKYWVNNHAHVLDGISEEFLRFIELHINAINLERYITGTAQPKMNQAKMNSIPVALPPLAEQMRIVAKVTELLALCDALEAKLTQAESASTTLLAAAVHHLLNGHAPGPASL